MIFLLFWSIFLYITAPSGIPRVTGFPGLALSAGTLRVRTPCPLQSRLGCFAILKAAKLPSLVLYSVASKGKKSIRGAALSGKCGQKKLHPSVALHSLASAGKNLSVALHSVASKGKKSIRSPTIIGKQGQKIHPWRCTHWQVRAKNPSVALYSVASKGKKIFAFVSEIEFLLHIYSIEEFILCQK